ncbi:MAG: PAS domain S-box protein [Sandaracinaceae bacterium]|nr:PAS domain S-box protein [Sandaracinaceae bacterium]
MTDPNDELERLRLSEARLRAALDSREIGVWTWSLATNETFWDERTRAIFGLGPDVRPSFRRFLGSLHVEDRAHVERVIERALSPSTREPYDVTVRVHRADELRWVSSRGSCTFDAEGRPLVFSGTVLDVTERERLREKAAHRARRAEVQGVMAKRLARARGPEESLRILCEETSHALGVPMVTIRVIDQATGLTSSAYVHGAPPGYAPKPADPEARERFFARHGTVAQFPEIQRVEDLPGGAYLHEIGLRSLAHARLVLDGATAGILMTGSMERRTLDDEELRYLEGMADVASAALMSGRLAARYREIVTAMTESVVLTDSAGRIVFANPAVEAFLGYRPEELLGDTGIKLWFEDDREAREARYRSIVSGTPARSETLRYRRRDGREVWGFETTIRFRDAGIRSGALTIVSDVTETRRIDAALQQAQRLESLGVLAGGIAHDFNNLLVGILGNASLALLEAAGQDALTLALRDIETAAVRASELTRQLLAYAGKGQFVLTKGRVNELVEGMARLVSASISKQVTLRYELAEEALVIEGDLTQLRQVVMNLVTNAADAIGASTGTITLRTHGVSLAREELSRFTLGELREPGRFVSIEVEDTGAGMSAETRARIFEPFFTTKFTGRGLGLSGVLGILRAHGGAIDVQSEEGVGSTFRVLLPRVADDVVVEPVAPAPKAPSQPSASRTILVVTTRSRCDA